MSVSLKVVGDGSTASRLLFEGNIGLPVATAPLPTGETCWPECSALGSRLASHTSNRRPATSGGASFFICKPQWRFAVLSGPASDGVLRWRPSYLDAQLSAADTFPFVYELTF